MSHLHRPIWAGIRAMERLARMFYQMNVIVMHKRSKIANFSHSDPVEKKFLDHPHTLRYAFPSG